MSARTERVIAFWLLVSAALILGLDVAGDIHEGSPLGHWMTELVLAVLAIFSAAVVGLRYLQMHSELRNTREGLESAIQELDRFRAESCKYIRGLSEVMDEQFERWKLTPAEKEIALLLIKGMSHKEVAEIRNTSERSARQQSLVIYQKSGLSGRAALAAFFLEELLSSPKPTGHQAD
jgi:DNA-binding CsgD family transcriptional regulator